MALLAVVTHEFDAFLAQDPSGVSTSGYLLFQVLEALNEMGHRWRLSAGLEAPPADAAILHVDATQVPKAYLALARRYPVAINFGARDISKRRIGKGLLKPGDDWAGPVIVKTNLNCFGQAELAANARATIVGRRPPYEVTPTRLQHYPILSGLSEVPDAFWSDQSLVVQRFLPERDPEGYALRVWLFAGARERCTRHVSPDPFVKGDRVISRRLVDVPPEIRAERERLGFDFGKFDFVVHDGEPILLDANRTPTMSARIAQYIKEGVQNLALGLADMLPR